MLHAHTISQLAHKQDGLMLDVRLGVDECCWEEGGGRDWFGSSMETPHGSAARNGNEKLEHPTRTCMRR